MNVGLIPFLIEKKIRLNKFGKLKAALLNVYFLMCSFEWRVIDTIPWLELLCHLLGLGPLLSQHERIHRLLDQVYSQVCLGRQAVLLQLYEPGTCNTKTLKSFLYTT